MSQNHFNEDEQQFVKLVDKFYLALSLTKICAKSCGLLSYNNNGYKLNDKEQQCMNICAGNIQNTYPSFLSKMKTTLEIPEAEGGDDDEEEEDEDDE